MMAQKRRTANTTVLWLVGLFASIVPSIMPLFLTSLRGFEQSHLKALNHALQLQTASSRAL